MMNKYGKIIMGVDGRYTVRTNDGETILCRAKGAFRHEAVKLLVGDDVCVECGEHGEDAIVASISERKNSLIRPPVANIGVLFIVMAAANPEPSLLTVDKLTCVAVVNGIVPAIVITKADIAADKAREYADIYRAAGFPVFVTDMNRKESTDALKLFIKSNSEGTTAVFAGASGVGKSTLMTLLFPELDLETGEISRKILRGKHTTRRVELYPLSELFPGVSGGYIADTPGFGLVDFVRFDFLGTTEPADTFPEFAPYIGHCKYTKCTHLCEDGCAVCRAVAEGKIPKSRHDDFRAIYAEAKKKKPWDKK